MPSINMIAARRAERKKLEKRIRFLVLIILFEIFLAVGFFGFMTARICSASRVLANLNEDLEVLKPKISEIKHYQSEIEKLKPRLDLLADSREQTLLWYSLLHGVSRSMAPKTWLSSLRVSLPEGPSPAAQETSDAAKPRAMTVNLKGVSTSQGLIGETMLRLNQCPEIDKVNLNFTQKGAASLEEAIEFELVAELKADEPGKGGKVANVSN